MIRRHVVVLSASAFVLLGVACVDLFHSTDFDTLCSTTPDDPACGGDGGAEAAIDAGTDSSRAHPNFCAWSTAEAKVQAQRACAFLGACEGPLGQSAFGPCVVHAQLAFDCAVTPTLRPRGDVDAFWSCLATVKTCADVDACVFPAGLQECVAVEAGSSEACGTVAANAASHVRCSGPAGRATGVEPCVMLGKSCAAETPSVAQCSGPLGFDKCTLSGCTGTSAVDCQTAGSRKLDHGIDCAGYGAGRCVPNSTDGGPTCAPGPDASACSDGAAVTCDGTSARSCVDGQEVLVDCARLGLQCDVSVPVSPYDPSAACISRSGPCTEPSDSCAGTTVMSCGRGLREQVDCASLGLGPCHTNESNLASCTAP